MARPTIHTAPEPAQPTPALRFAVTCPVCGGPIALTNRGTGAVPGGAPVERVGAVVECEPCARRFLVTAQLQSAGSVARPGERQGARWARM